MRARFTMSLPVEKWISVYSLRYTGLVFKVRSMLLLDDGTGNVLFEIAGDGTGRFSTAFKKDAPVLSFTILHESPNFLLLDVHMGEPLLIEAFAKSNVPVFYPIIIAAGKATVELVAARSRIDGLLMVMADAGFSPELHRIGRFERHTLLTPRQRDILSRACDAGYFDVPRRVELRDLASGLGMSASTLSETLRRIVSKACRYYLQGTGAARE